MAAGALTSYFGHDEWAKFAPGLKDLDDALEVRKRVLTALEAAERATDPRERQRLLTFVVVGGGPTGVELAGAIADLSRDIVAVDFKRLDRKAVRVVLVEMNDRILTPFEPPLSAKAKAQLEDLGVEVRNGVRVEAIDAGSVRVGGETLQAGTVLWGAGVRPSPLAAALGVPRDAAGRVIVGQDCAVPDHPEVFVIGDMASFVPEDGQAPLPGISPVAIQQARLVGRNILDEVRGLPRQKFRYFDKGFMATIGRARAVAQIGRLRLSGFFAWLTWVFIHLWYLVGFRNRVAVFTNWIWAYVISRHGARVITGRHPAAPDKR
jgi:NADH dehydrogenase